MAFKVHKYDEIKFFKIAKLNLRGKAKDWFKKLQVTPTNWNEIKIDMEQKFWEVDMDEIIMKVNNLKQEPR
jgi:predicted nucleotidyltransferase component of viral defense system